MLILRNISYTLPNKDLLFHNISLTVNHQDKIALIGKNGVGKSTLLKILAGELQHSFGQKLLESEPYYLPQIFGQYNHLTIAQAMNIEKKLNAFHAILNGKTDEKYYATLNDDWTIETRCHEALDHWQLNDLGLNQKMSSLSGGQKTRVLLAGISVHLPQMILMDEPSNHLDFLGRKLLYQFIQSTSSTILIVSHDRKLLNLVNTIAEMESNGIAIYGGNYDFYAEQKAIKTEAIKQDLQSKEKALRKAKDKQRESSERRQKLDARGKKKHLRSGTPRILMNKLKNDAESSSAKLKSVHNKKIEGISGEVRGLRESLPEIDKMKFGFEDSGLHKGKILFEARDLNFSYEIRSLWSESLNLEIISGERIALKGLNGSGKTTFIKLLLGSLKPSQGVLKRAISKSVYIDQDYSLIDNRLTVLDQAQQFNTSTLPDHEIKIRLNRFLFPKEDWDKSCSALSGGERMRLILCCLTIGHQSPDLIVLDEPTNNLDIQNIEILTKAINQYHGTLIVVSHDEQFLEEVNVEREIELQRNR